MPPSLAKLLSFGLVTISLALAAPLQQGGVTFADPTKTGGSMLDSSAGLGEPLNVGGPQPLFSILCSRHSV